MKNYLVTYKKTGKTMLFKFDLNGFLIAFETTFTLNRSTYHYFKKHFPFEVDDLQHFKAAAEFKVDELLQDLSFQSFWNTYDRKVGNKSRSQKLWKGLNDTEKAKALNYIKTYDNFLVMNQGIQKLYPETYLSQKRFNNE
jgi:hypothetical protein